jgi:putative hemolysin
MKWPRRRFTLFGGLILSILIVNSPIVLLGVLMSIAVLIFLVILNGWFAMSEIALVTSRKNRLQVLADDGDPGAITALKLANKPTTFLSTIQIGITIIGILNGVIGEAALAGPISSWLTKFGVQAHTASVFNRIISAYL